MNSHKGPPGTCALIYRRPQSAVSGGKREKMAGSTIIFEVGEGVM